MRASTSERRRRARSRRLSKRHAAHPRNVPTRRLLTRLESVSHVVQEESMRRLISALVVALAVAVPAAALADQPTSTDQNNAAKECKALRKAMGDVNFTKAFGTNKNGKNAYGKCVSKKAREEATERSDATKNAAKQCKAEQADSNFAATHGGKTFDQ